MAIDTDISTTCEEMKDNKVSLRLKAFNKMYTMLSSRLNEMNQAISGNPNLSWETIFLSAHIGLVNHSSKLWSTSTELNENDTKISSYIRVVQKICDAPSCESLAIPYVEIVSQVMSIIGDEGHTNYFGRQYLQILQKHVLNLKRNLSEISLETWKGLLSQLFKLMESKNHNIALLDIVQCTTSLIEVGTNCSFLAVDLSKYLKRLQKLLETNENNRDRLELLKTSYHCCSNIAVDFRFEVCKFTESTMKYIHKVYDKNASEEQKTTMFKLMDLALLVHSPNLKNDRSKLNYVNDSKEWHTQLRNFAYIMKQEMHLPPKTKYRSETKPVINQIFNQFAARLCYIIYWDDTIWNDQDSESGEQSAKRVKHGNKLQTLLDFACPAENEFNWKWILVICEMIQEFPDSLIAEDFQPFLQLLAQFQPTIEYDIQMYAFSKCCLILLQNEETFMSTHNFIVVNFCKDFWHKIADCASRTCTSNCKTATENHILLQILIRFQKFPSSNFIEDLIKIFLTNLTVKSDITLQTLLTILENFNLDSLPNAKELNNKILAYVFEKPTLAVLKTIIVGGKASPGVLAKLGVICTLSKTDVVNFKKSDDDFKQLFDHWKLNEQFCYLQHMREFEKCILLKSNECLLIEDSDFQTLERISSKDVEIPIEIKCIIDQTALEGLQKLLDHHQKLLSEDDNSETIKDFLKCLLENTEILINLLDHYIQFEAFNTEKLKSSFVTKKISFNLQHVEYLFGLLLSKGGLDLKDTNQLLVLLKSLVDTKYHHVVCKEIRRSELINCLKWTGKQCINSFYKFQATQFGWDLFVNSKMEQKIKYQAVEILILCNHYESVNSALIEKLLKRITFDYADNVELHTVFHLIKLLGCQNRVTEGIALWAMALVIEICIDYHQNQYISEKLIEGISDVIQFAKDHNSETSNVLVLVDSFVTICSQMSYNPNITVKCLEQLKTFHQFYFHLYENDAEQRTVKIYNNMVEFVNSELLVVKMAAVKCLSFVLKSEIEKNEDFENVSWARRTKIEIFKKIKLRKIECSVNDLQVPIDDDVQINTISVYLQFLSATLSVNFVLRKPMMLELSKLFLRYSLKEELAQKTFQKIVKFLKCDVESLMDSNNILWLVSQWLYAHFVLTKFPWYFTASKSLNEFMNSHLKLMLLAILKNDGKKFEDFCNTTEIRVNIAIEKVLPNCLAFMLPIQAAVPNLKFEDKAESMNCKIEKYFKKDQLKPFLLQNVAKVIGFVLENVYDEKMFQEICDFNFEIFRDPEMINAKGFEMCLNHLGKNFKTTGSQSLLTHFCNTRPDLLENLLMNCKSKIQSTTLKEHKLLYLLQYCVFVKHLLDYLNEPAKKDDIKGFIVRDVVYFTCYLLIEKDYGSRVNETACNFLHIILTNIFPVCSEVVKPFLNYIVSSLTSVCKGKPTPLQRKSLATIKFLIVDQKSLLNDNIGYLDDFPNNDLFAELRHEQQEIKYKSGKFTLIQEIEHFLLTDNRKIEGLVSLREHLGSKTEEFHLLFDDLGKTLGFSEDGEQSILHKLIRALISYVKKGDTDQEKSIEAIKCLGEIGAYDLATMVFMNQDKLSTVYQPTTTVDGCIEMICKVSLNKLSSTLLLRQDPRVFSVASECCFHIFNSNHAIHYRADDEYLRPFHTKTLNGKMLFNAQPTTNFSLDFVKIFKNHEFDSYNTWITKLANNLLFFVGDQVLMKVTDVECTYAEQIVPIIIQLILCYNNSELNENIVKSVNYYFDEHCEKQKSLQVYENSMYLNKFAIKIMLNIVECIRMYRQNNPSVPFVCEFNHLSIAKVAKYCQAYFTAVLYCELWAQKKLSDEATNIIANKNLQEIMYEAYTSIGIHDALDLFVNPITNRSLYMQTTNESFRNLLEHNRLGIESEDQMEIYLKLLNDMGLHFMAHKLAQSSVVQVPYQYECLWRLCDWNVLTDADTERKPTKTVDFKVEFEKYHYSSLKCLKNNDELGCKITVDKARKSILQMLKEESLECTQNIYKFMRMSQLLQQVEDFSIITFSRSHDSHLKMLNKWNCLDKLPYHDFKIIEPVLSQRNSVLDTANIRAGRRTWIPEALQVNMMFIIKEAISGGCNNDAIKMISKMKSLENLLPSFKAELFIQDAEISWKMNNKQLAKHSLRRVMEEKELERETLLKCKAYKMYGIYLADSYTEEIGTIYTNYFKPSVMWLEKYAKHRNKSHLVQALLENPQSSQTPSNTLDDAESRKIKKHVGIFDIIAKYHDRDYIEKCEYIKSPAFEEKKRNLVRNNQKMILAHEKSKSIKSSIDDKRAYTIIKRNTEIDAAEIKNVEKQKHNAAKLAMYYYIRGAINDPDTNALSIFRIISLWLANPNNNLIEKMLSSHLQEIPSYKFIVALPQLTVRLTDGKDKVSELIAALLTRCALDHPHHTLPLILALVNSYADSTEKTVEPEPRVVGANKLWVKLSKMKTLHPIMKQLESMSTCLIGLANEAIEKLPANHKIIKLTGLDLIHCPTIELPVSNSCKYDNIISVVRWEHQFELVGGINAPKKIFCRTSDGKIRSQLLKGKDDLRQDAVMQQVFAVVNQLLRAHKETNKIKANVRTYKVVAFSRRSGILEWCDNTITVGNYLIGTRSSKKSVMGAHQRLRPQDWTSRKCIEAMQSVDTAGNTEKLECFNKICANIHPVFQEFFLENYQSPGVWFERRLAYITSLAVSSMVGYILGIGDRHVQNILVDLKTAEVIHIDFGIAFEQGRVLPHPELIPFRLTRDLVAPMGVSGVDGVFRKTCEKTLQLLRENESTLTTILEVLLYDPLYSWTMTIAKAQRHQQDNSVKGVDSNEQADDDNRNATASRALLKVQAKLKGQADDTTAYSSVEGQVECLIKKAMNPSLLCRLFTGWQPFL
ncbi:unnamed protein product [Diamesa serratosioi]